MKPPSSASSCAPAESVDVPRRTAVALKLADYLELTKPRIALLALVTVTVGYTLSHTGPWQLVPLLHALSGIALVAAGSSALNQLVERRTDACMQRTANRPLPAGRLSPVEVLLFGVSTGGLGSLYLAVWVNSLTAILAVLTLLLYAAVYTPLKRVTSLCTAVGAIPGALPPVLGWTAAGSALDAKAFSLFAILFLWQFPHTLAIGWLYRDEHSRAGLRMLPVPGTAPRVAGWMAVGYALALLPVSLLPLQFGLAGRYYSLAAIVLGVGYLLSAVRFMLNESSSTARGLFWSSLLYLPALLLTLTWDNMYVTWSASQRLPSSQPAAVNVSTTVVETDNEPMKKWEPLDNFELTERSGRQVTQADFLGSPWVASFVFTRCAGPCPRIMGQMRILQDELKGTDVRFVTFTVDPEHDTPEVLQRYADALKADPQRWLFLTGDREEIYRLIADSFKLSAGEGAGEPFHSSRVVHVDAQGRPVKSYLFPADTERVALRRALQRPAQSESH